MIALIICNIIVASGKLMDYKTDRLIDTGSTLGNIKYIYRK